MLKFSVSDAAQVCGGQYCGEDRSLTRLWFTNSNDVTEDSAFAALPGALSDGHKYIRSAIEHGASVIMANQSSMEQYGIKSGDYPDISFIFTEDTERSLIALAEYYLDKTAPTTVGITGSVGKTTTRELAYAAIKGTRKVHTAIKSFNTLIGCALTILAMPTDTEVLLLEMGTNHFGDLSEIVSHFPVHIAVITEVIAAHTEVFGDLDGVLRAKAEICESRALQRIIYNGDSVNLNFYMKNHYNDIPKNPLGKYKPEYEIKVGSGMIMLHGDIPKMGCRVVYNNNFLEGETFLLGSHNIYNIVFAAEIALKVGVDIFDALRRIGNVQPVEGRGVWKKYGSSFIVDESYNANAISTAAAISNAENVADRTYRKKIALLGGMKELGPLTLASHQYVIDRLEKFDAVLLLGKEWQECKLGDNMRIFDTFEAFLCAVEALDTEYAVILVKGSHSYGLNRIVEHFLNAE